MIRLSTSLVAACLLASAPPAAADCSVAMADWQPRERVAEAAAGHGWTVDRIRLDDGCYEVIGTDAAGRPIEAKLDPATLRVLELEFEDHDHSPGGEDHGDDD